MTNIQHFCDKVQEPLGYKPSYWLLYNLLMHKRDLPKVQRIISLVQTADRIDEVFEETLDSSWLEKSTRIEAEILRLLSEDDPFTFPVDEDEVSI